MREIGSEFWLNDINIEENRSLDHLFNWGDDRRFLYTGRTAIDYVLEDIPKSVKKVYMPSYCCESMLLPFIERNIIIEFYHVRFNDNQDLVYDINYEKEFDLFFATSYFGFHDTVMDSIINKIKTKDVIVVEDITHRLLSTQNYSKNADYLVASLRKWFELPSGGLAIKLNGTFKEIHLNSPNSKLINKKIDAMMLKGEYINNSERYNGKKKELFLKMFSEFNFSLNKNYKNTSIDDFSKTFLSSINLNKIRQKRQENARCLYENLKNSQSLRFLIREPNFKEDCPLFVPLLVKEDIRDPLRNFLISKEIYCPVHWPVPRNIQLSNEDNKIYSRELSLVCDQRYSTADMKRIISTIGEFFELL